MKLFFVKTPVFFHLGFLFLLMQCSGGEAPVVYPSSSLGSTITHKKYYPNGKISREFSMLADSTKHGECRYYYPEGGLFKSVNFQRGLQHGITKTYYLNQQLESVTPYEKGFPHGPSVWYDKEGNLTKEATYVRGEIDGEVKHYYPEGSLQGRYTYEKGQKKGPGYDYFPNGQLKRYQWFNMVGRPSFAMMFDEEGKVKDAAGRLIADLEVDKGALSWDGKLSIGMAVAVPPGFAGEVVVKKFVNGQGSQQKRQLRPERNTWRYRSGLREKAEYRIQIIARIEGPEGYSLTSYVRQIRVDVSGRTPRVVYE